jgi:hypothetical protein
VSKRKWIDPQVKRRNIYKSRNDVLRGMGFDSYQEYLKSSLWASIRWRVLKANPDCYVCERKANQVHHEAYRKIDLDGRCLDRLRSLCGRCHYRIEFRDRDKLKLNTKQAKTKMRQQRTLNLKAKAAEELDSAFLVQYARSKGDRS